MSKILKSEQSVKKNGALSNMDKPSMAYEDDFKPEIVWKNVAIFLVLHVGALYAFFLPKKHSTIVWWWTIAFVQAFGVTVGAHRLFTHRSFKANAKLRFLLIFMQTLAVENSVFEWVRDHRVHHKYVDTNADPHNSKRGFFFSHIGWLMCKKHPDVKKFGGRIDMSDLEVDKMVMFQHKYYMPLALLIGFAFPRLFCIFVLGESFKVAFFSFFQCYIFCLHGVWLINSGAHLWGYKPFDKNATSTDSYSIGFFAVGEGWHNYHHCFPWDYKAAELPTIWCNLSLGVINFFAWLGWATDLKTVSQEMINKRAQRTGDGTHKHPKFDENNNLIGEKDFADHSSLWGWDDKEMTDNDKKCVEIINKVYD